MKTIINFFKNNYKKIITVIVIVIFMSILNSFFGNNNFFKKISVENIKYVKIAGTKLKVELALTPLAQEQGLSGRSEIKDDQGMLFIFEKPSKYFFWMKNMNFPIDIIWINKDMKVIYVEKNVKPDSYPQTFGPNEDAQYVLEVKALFSEKNNLKENNKVIFSI